MKLTTSETDLCCAILVGIALRAAVSLHPYSGSSKPPMYGDYEAQRHWQEITLNLPPKEWYQNSTDNDLQYWGLDYPPLTAYHSYAMGAIADMKNACFVELHKSRGIESKEHKSFMRFTVLLADFVIYIPACLSIYFTLDKKVLGLPTIALIMVFPGQALIDNGHFQYNNISLGLFLLSISAIVKKKFNFGALFFSLALNYKQMELYHAIPIFVFLLQVCLKQKSWKQAAVKFFSFAFIVLFVFGFLWFPWLHSFSSFSAVIKRLFPVARGVFEDKVANLWCVVDLVYKIKKNFTNQDMLLICLAITCCVVISLNMDLFLNVSNERFLRCLVNTAMSFFLFSFQVHEKSILLVAISTFFLFPLNPVEVIWFLEGSSFSMLPLFLKDSLLLAFWAMFLISHISNNIFYINYFSPVNNSKIYEIRKISIVLMIVLFLVMYKAPTPLQYPFLWPLLIAIFSFIQFSLFYLFNIYYQTRACRIK